MVNQQQGAASGQLNTRVGNTNATRSLGDSNYLSVPDGDGVRGRQHNTSAPLNGHTVTNPSLTKRRPVSPQNIQSHPTGLGIQIHPATAPQFGVLQKLPGEIPSPPGSPNLHNELSVLEEPRKEPPDGDLIDLDSESPRGTKTKLDPGGSLNGCTSQFDLCPKNDEDLAWEYFHRVSLLDIDDLSQVPPPLRDQINEVVKLRIPTPQALENTPGAAGDGAGNRRPSRAGGSLEQDEIETCFCGQYTLPHADCFFCYPCQYIYCVVCWDTLPLHRRQRMHGGIQHEKTDPEVARRIERTLESDLSEEGQAFLHVQDEDTSWFGALKDDDGDLVFQDYGRYPDLMAEKSTQNQKLRYPGLVSFVGQTGAGKSTVVKLLIELKSAGHRKVQGPVVGSVHHQDIPTSGDVHLYSDPSTSDTVYPILYADCEGLDGGERVPMGAKSRNKGRRRRSESQPKRTMNGFSKQKKRRTASQRDILWAMNDRTRSREYIVRNLYPRLLCTFSDTIVFVTKNPRAVENVIEQLINWAAAALEKSSNQPVLPHAIIVLNAAENNTDPRLWDVDESTADLMRSVGPAILSYNLRQHVDFWELRNKDITSVEDLLLSYYSTVRVVRIPEKGRPKLINDQVKRLYEEIKNACGKSRESKHKLRMLLNSDEMQPYLQHAFDHFCGDLDIPFDFVQASFANNPIPSDFGGNILKLAINIMEVWKDRLDGPAIFRELSYIVASCIMLDSVRHRTLGPAESVFPEYMEHCDDALDDFCDRHWPCEYVSAGGRCVNVRSGHNTKGHQLKNGHVLAVGEYSSLFSSQNFRQTFRDLVYENLVCLVKKLQDATHASAHLEVQEAANIHRNFVLKNFFHHLNGARNFISHTACFSCLISPPEHPLPCGHVLCTPCVRAFGVSRGKSSVEMKVCPLHYDESEAKVPPHWPIFIKPASAGVRILSLDGGGVRGIVELTMLQQLERALGNGLHIQDFFDLIVGTSTGGIITLGLGACGWSVQHCIDSFRHLCKQAFTKRKGIGLPGIEFLISASTHSRFKTKPLESALRQFYGDGQLFGGPRCDLPLDNLERITKVAVTTTTTAATVVVLGNYNRHSIVDDPPYWFRRSEKPAGEMKIWEAARSTSAAPTFFKPFFHEQSGQSYQDGGIYYNNPIEVAVREHRLIWPETAERHPDLVLSVGTGFNPSSEHRQDHPSPRLRTWGMISHAKALARIAIDHIESSLNSEKTWKIFLERDHPHKRFRDRYVRLNLALDKDPPRLDDISAMDELREMTLSRLTKERQLLNSLADRLLATCFYFEPRCSYDIPESDQSFTVEGNIYCRFARGSDQIRSLGEAFRERSRTIFNHGSGEYQPYFFIHERRREREGQQLIIRDRIIREMIRDGHFSIGKISIQVTERMAETEILLCLDGDSNDPQSYPISGFPRCLLEEDPGSILSSKSTLSLRRMRSRTPNRSHHRGQWKKPPPRSRNTTFDPIDKYGGPSYCYPGGETSETLSMISRRFSRSSPPATSSDTVVPGRVELGGDTIYELATNFNVLPDAGRPPTSPTR